MMSPNNSCDPRAIGYAIACIGVIGAERMVGAECLARRRLPVPNMIADLDQAPKERVEKPVWRVAFFGRLEERKGIKLFVDAVQVSSAHDPGPLPSSSPSTSLPYCISV